MELRQLSYFDAVVRCGGFTSAAVHLHVAQPAVSAQIRRLEKELGAQLLSRTTRRVTLTEAGELFLVRVRRALGELDAGRSDLAALAEVLLGRVILGSTQILGPFDLPAALADFAVRFPGVSLTLRTSLVGSMFASLDAGEVDLVLGPLADDVPAAYAIHRLAQEQLVVITPPGHRLARTPRIALAELADETFVCLPVGTGLRRLLDRAAATARFTPRVQFEATSPSSIRELVGAGLGVALTVASAAENPGARVGVHRLEPTPEHPPYGIVHDPRRPLSPAAAALRDHLMRTADALPAAPDRDGP